MDRYYGFFLGTLAVWRVTHAVTEEDGPAKVLVRLRRALDGSAWATLLECFYCASVWIALPCAALIGTLIGSGFGEKALLWLALSGAACLVQRVAKREPPAVYWEDKEESDVLRRRPHGPRSLGDTA
jgi:hypothetical protein